MMPKPSQVLPPRLAVLAGLAVIKRRDQKQEPTWTIQSSGPLFKAVGSGGGYPRFIRDNPTVVKHTMARQLGWPDLLDRIRAQANKHQTLARVRGFARENADFEIFLES
jgi:hypothetical protein